MNIQKSYKTFISISLRRTHNQSPPYERYKISLREKKSKKRAQHPTKETECTRSFEVRRGPTVASTSELDGIPEGENS